MVKILNTEKIYRTILGEKSVPILQLNLLFFRNNSKLKKNYVLASIIQLFSIHFVITPNFIFYFFFVFFFVFYRSNKKLTCNKNL